MRLQFQLPATESARGWLAAQGVRDAHDALAWAGGAPLHALAAEAPDRAKVRNWLVERFFDAPDADPVELSGQIDAETLPILVACLQRWCHDLLLVRLTGNPRYYPGRAQILHRAAERADLSGLLGFLREIQSTVRLLEHPLNPRLVAESCLIGYRDLFAAWR
jgi:DNA polymerase-3 subunit delta'